METYSQTLLFLRDLSLHHIIETARTTSTLISCTAKSSARVILIVIAIPLFSSCLCGIFFSRLLTNVISWETSTLSRLCWLVSSLLPSTDWKRPGKKSLQRRKSKPRFSSAIYFPGEVGEELVRKAIVLFGGVKFAGAWGYSSVPFRVVQRGCGLWSIIFKK